MSDDLRKRLESLEQEVAHLKEQRRPRGVRYRSALAIGEVPLLAVAMGPDPDRGEVRGHAKGIVAIGDMATGILAFGGLARGVVAFGGLAVGGLSVGGFSVGALVAIGGFALGSIALGGAAVGGVAIGGGAAGYYACGGATAGAFVFGPQRQDPEADAFFRRYRLGELCQKR